MTHAFRAKFALPLAAAALLILPLAAPALRAAPPAGASAGSDLSASQKAQMQARQEQMQKDVMALRADTKLTPAQKQAKYQTLIQAVDKDMMAILTPAQRTLLLKQRQINADAKSQIDALRADKTLTDAQKQTRYEGILRTRQAALLATLPPDERTKVEKEHQAELGRVAEANRIGAELQKSLSKKAEAQIRQITVETRGKMQAVAADTTLSSAAKADRMRSLGQEAETRINSYLTPAQRAQYAKYHQLISAAPAP